MNIFYLDKDPIKAARAHSDVHVRKMIVESAQMLSTAHRVLDGEMIIKLNKIGSRMKVWVLEDERQDELYKSTHVNHPCNIWIRESAENYNYLHALLEELVKEYTYRRADAKKHATTRLVEPLRNLPENIPNVAGTPFRIAAGDLTGDDPIEVYREYYRVDKAHLLDYTVREEPTWL